MPVKRKKVKRFVIDVNCLISIFLTREIDWLIEYVDKNSIEIFVDKFLLKELSAVLFYPKFNRYFSGDKIKYINSIKDIAIDIESDDFHIQCPDPEDNYLYNLALTANAKLLVTGEKALLQWKDSPVETISLSTFKELF